jgi:hypothetical protein
MFPFSSDERETRTLLRPIERANKVLWLKSAISNVPNRVVVSLPSPEDGRRSNFRNVAFCTICNSGRRSKSSNPMILRLSQAKFRSFEGLFRLRWYVCGFSQSLELNLGLVTWSMLPLRFGSLDRRFTGPLFIVSVLNGFHQYIGLFHIAVRNVRKIFPQRRHLKGTSQTFVIRRMI